MIKDLEKEYLEDLDHYDEGMGIHSTSYGKCKERLIRLAKIDNSNPSEFKIVNYKGQYYLQINVNDDEATQIQLPLLEDEIKDVQLAINKFKQINQTKPSEANIDTATEMLLTELEMLSDCAVAIEEEPSSNWIEYAETVAELDLKLHFAYLDIKQALLKEQEQEKVLEIIKEKCLTNCNIALVKDNVHYENYCKEFEYFLNKYNESPNGFEITKEDLLTQEEFDLLKRYCDEEKD